MDYNKIIGILIVIIAIIIAGGFIIINNSNHTAEVINTTATSNNNVVEQTSENEVVSESSSENNGYHLVLGEDGIYYTVDDDGNILETLGPSKRYYPNGYNGMESVEYPNAEPSYNYMNH